MILEDMQQGTDAWLELRKTKVTATDAMAIMGVSPWTNALELWQEKVGLKEPKSINSAMTRGMLLEPKARACYEKMTGELMLPEVVLHPVDDWMMASLDGLSLDRKKILEIKCTSRKNHDIAKNGQIPEYYIPQVQHQIYVAGVDTCEYFSFDGVDGVVVVVRRDDAYIARMIEKEREFYHCMITFTEPTL